MDSLTRAPIIATIAFSFMTHTPPSEARRWPLGAASAGADRLRADEQVRQRGVVQEPCSEPSHRPVVSARLSCRRMILTHVGTEMLDRMSEVREEVATDGLVITV